MDSNEAAIPAIFRLAFRPFFLLGALFSILSLVVWTGALTGKIELVVYGGPLWWHVHEMLFGFVSAIVVGFLLTAVQTWTGQPGIRGMGLVALLLLWLCGRIGFFLVLPATLVALIDIAFLVFAAGLLALPIVRVQQWRNILFVPVLLAMTGANVAMHWSAQSGDTQLQAQAGIAMVMVITLLMTVMAGRVVPMFTASGTGTERVATIRGLEHLSLIVMLLAVAASFDALGLPAQVTASLFWVAAAVHSLRALRWRMWVTLRAPLVWSLHLSYWCIVLGLLLYGMSLVTESVTRTQAIHTLTVGAMSMMILAMISRVSLGHTGRPIVAPRVIALVFALLFGAFLVRVFGSYWFDDYLRQITWAAGLWVMAYSGFVLLYLPVLMMPRVDGGPG